MSDVEKDKIEQYASAIIKHLTLVFGVHAEEIERKEPGYKAVIMFNVVTNFVAHIMINALNEGAYEEAVEYFLDEQRKTLLAALKRKYSVMDKMRK